MAKKEKVPVKTGSGDAVREAEYEYEFPESIEEAIQMLQGESADPNAGRILALQFVNRSWQIAGQAAARKILGDTDMTLDEAKEKINEFMPTWRPGIAVPRVAAAKVADPAKYVLDNWDTLPLERQQEMIRGIASKFGGPLANLLMEQLAQQTGGVSESSEAEEIPEYGSPEDEGEESSEESGDESGGGSRRRRR
jgi:hypothetical protein